MPFSYFLSVVLLGFVLIVLLLFVVYFLKKRVSPF